MKRVTAFAPTLLVLLLLLLSTAATNAPPQLSLQPPAIAARQNLPTNPIMFVTQVPIPADFTTIGSTFGNHLATFGSVGRGGDLWIRYPDGSLRNLTAKAGYINSGFLEGPSEGLAVREPAIHWSGTKAVFSMVIGTSEQYDHGNYRWQLYEVEGFGQSDPPSALKITKVPNQPTAYNNVSPLYGTAGRIIFTSDRPRNGAAHLYPQLDEYEEAPTVSGLWSMNPTVTGGDLKLLDHAPSGDFTPIIDSFGRIIFTRWDHLQRDQQADADAVDGADYGTFNYTDESADATGLLNNRSEVFPEPRGDRTDLLAGTNLLGHTFNHFFPWQMNEDGTELEVLNHVGRHELISGGYLGYTFTNDPNLTYFADPAGHSNPNRIVQSDGGLFQIKEDPTTPGLYLATNAREFGSHAAGQLISLTGAPTLNGDQMVVSYLTHPDTLSPTDTPGPNHTGLYRNPLPLANGVLVAVHTAETRADANEGSVANPVSRYDFRLKSLSQSGPYWQPDQFLTPGITKTVSYWNPDVLVEYNAVTLWELDPVEVRARPIPTPAAPSLPGPEQQIFSEENINPNDLRTYLEQNNLALVVSRNVTSRDDLDRQQPFNLKIAGSNTQTLGTTGKIYEVAYLQFFQADLIRGIDYGNSPGRRVLAQALHDSAVNNPQASCTAPPGSVRLAEDGSMAAFVPARRAMSWQLTDASGTGIVRERFWLTFQPGEMRVCASCHGLNDLDQSGQPEPTNPPEALRDLLQYWQDNQSLSLTCQQVYLPSIIK